MPAMGDPQPIPYEGDFGLTVVPLMPAAVWERAAGPGSDSGCRLIGQLTSS